MRKAWLENFLHSILILIKLIAFVGFFSLIGLWWLPEFSRGRMNVSLLQATFTLPLTFIVYYKIVIRQKVSHSPLHFYFYSLLALCALAGYLYGVFFKWAS